MSLPSPNFNNIKDNIRKDIKFSCPPKVKDNSIACNFKLQIVEENE